MPAPRILVTGGAGFVGSNLAVALKQNLGQACFVVAMDNLYRRGSELTIARLREHGVRFHYGDVRDPGTFPEGGFDVLVECSAEPSVMAGVAGSPDYLVQTNLLGAYHCLEKARRWDATFLFLSTSRVYPIARLEAQPWRETATRYEWLDGNEPGISRMGVSEACATDGARSLYGWTKHAAEQLIVEYRAAFGVKTIVNRCGVLAGPWQFGKVDQGVVSLWVQAHLFDRPLRYIGYGGTGKQVRDVLHVDDLADLVLAQIADMRKWDGWVGNVAGGRDNSVSLLELTELCQDVTGRSVRVDRAPETRAGDLRVFVADCTRLAREMDWRPRRSVRDVVTDCAAWVSRYASAVEALAG